MNDTLVAYFSATGITERVARNLASVLDCPLYEIEPEKPYTGDDLDWNSRDSRSSWEMTHKTHRPALKDPMPNLQEVKTVFLGFPIWWYVAPTLVNTFLEQGDFAGKTIIVFVTSGGSPVGRSIQELMPSAPDALFKGGRRFPASTSKETLKKWALDEMKQTD